MTMKLRNYQQIAITKIYSYWQNIGKRPVVVAPMGSGKSAIIAGFCEQTTKVWPDTRILIITDSKEIVFQNERELKKYWSDAPTGVYSAGLHRREKNTQIVFAGIQSIYKRIFEFSPSFSVVCIDEAHMVSQKNTSMYQQLLRDACVANPNCHFFGTTGTPFRLDQGFLWNSKSAFFDGCAYEIKLTTLIEHGFLCPMISKGGLKNIDLRNVKIQGGEYNQSDLAYAANDPCIIKFAVNEIVACGKDRVAWIVFCAGIKHAKNVLLELQSHNISAGLVTSKMNSKDRDLTINNFKTGKIQAIVNVNILTKGVNVPKCDLIVLLTATKSTAKYAQMAGRGLRTFPGKKNCLLLDFGNNIITHGELDNLTPAQKGTGNTTPLKQCPECRAIINISYRECPQCGYCYPAQDEICPNHGTEAYDGAVLLSQNKPFWCDVTDIHYSRHQKSGKPDSVKITFFSGLSKQYLMWLAPDHGGYAAKRAEIYITAAEGKAKNVNEILSSWYSWKKPTRIQVKKNGKFFNILNIDFGNITHTKQKMLV
ncbi:DNA helicase [bacterium]|nr:MAG: DNA helicase [bacterium]